MSPPDPRSDLRRPPNVMQGQAIALEAEPAYPLDARDDSPMPTVEPPRGTRDLLNR